MSSLSRTHTQLPPPEEGLLFDAAAVVVAVAVAAVCCLVDRNRMDAKMVHPTSWRSMVNDGDGPSSMAGRE